MINNESQCTAISDEEVIRNYANMVYRLAYAQVRSKSDADDIFQEVFLRYVQKQPIFLSEEHRKAWLLRVTVNCAKKHWASYWFQHIVPLEETFAFSEPEEIGLDEEIQKLRPRYRAVIHLFYYEGCSIAEISLAMGTKEATVRTQLTRARRQLGDLLKGDYDG